MKTITNTIAFIIFCSWLLFGLAVNIGLMYLGISVIRYLWALAFA